MTLFLNITCRWGDYKNKQPYNNQNEVRLIKLKKIKKTKQNLYVCCILHIEIIEAWSFKIYSENFCYNKKLWGDYKNIGSAFSC